MNFPTKQAVLAYLYSLGLSAQAVLSAILITGYTAGPQHGGFDINDPTTLVPFLAHSWVAFLFAVVFSIGPYARFKQGYSAATSGSQPPPEQAQREDPQIMDTGNTSTAAVDRNAPANILMTRSGLTPVVADHVAALQASPDSGSQLVGEIIQGGEEYLTGQPVKINFAVPKETLSFDSTNPFGVKYAWTFGEQNGDIVLIGKPQ